MTARARLTPHQREVLQRITPWLALSYEHPQSGRPLPRLVSARVIPNGSWIGQLDLADETMDSADVCRCPIKAVGSDMALWHLCTKGYLVHVANFTTRRGATRMVYRLADPS